MKEFIHFIQTMNFENEGNSIEAFEFLIISNSLNFQIPHPNTLLGSRDNK